MTTLGNNIGEKINSLRKQKELTLEELAGLSESSKSYIWELENRNPLRPSAEKLLKIAAALDVTLDYLIGDSVQVEDARDEMFYREYQGMDPAVKDKIRQMVKLWQDE